MTLGEYKRFLLAYRGRNRAAALRGLQSAAMRGVQVIQTEIIPSRVPQPVDRSLYRGGWRFSFEPDGALIFNNEPHAPEVEFGVRAANVKIGKAMIQALAEWAVRKGLASAGKEAVSAAWAIAKTMQRRGIFGQGLGILRELVRDRVHGIVTEEVVRELKLEKTRR